MALVRGLHGLSGAVRVEVLTDTPGRFQPGSILYVEGQDAPLTVDWMGPSKPGLLVRFAELTSREAVEPLRDRYLEVVPDAPLPEGSWYWHQIVGLEARTTDGEVLGTVREVFRAGAGEVYVIGGGPRGEVLVPAVRGIVTELAPAEGRLVVDAVALDLPALVSPEDGPQPAEAGMAPDPPTEPDAGADATPDAEAARPDAEAARPDAEADATLDADPASGSARGEEPVPPG